METQEFKHLYFKPKKPYKPKEINVISFDIETYGQKNYFYSVGFYHINNGKEQFYYTTDIDEAHHYILDQPKNTYFIATNLGFDINGLFTINELIKNFELIIQNGNLRIIIGKKHILKQKYFFDTFNYAPLSVKKMGEILKIPKIKSPSFWKKTYDKENETYEITPTKPKSKNEKEELKKYNKRDCEVTYKFFKLLEKEIHKIPANIKLTIASTALEIFKTNYLKQEIKRKDIENFPLIYKAYYGGRTETYIRGKHQLKCYDINSLYPSAMLNELPDPNSYEEIKKNKTIKNIETYLGVSEITFKTPTNIYYPILPKKCLKTGKLKFTRGLQTGAYNHNEIVFALKNGYQIIKIHKQIIYKKSKKYFYKYVKDIYSKRMKEKGKSTEIVYKLLHSSLYGKFAQKPINKTIWLTDEDIENEIIKGKKINKDIKSYQEVSYYTQLDTNTKNYNIPIWSSYTSSYARIIMYPYINKGLTYNTDTDSVFIKETLPESKKIGKMKLEYEGEFELIKPKFYQVTTKNETKTKIKGFSKATPKNFKELTQGKTQKYTKFIKFKESIIRQLKPNQTIKQPKKLNTHDNKRIWYGNISIPDIQINN